MSRLETVLEKAAMRRNSMPAPAKAAAFYQERKLMDQLLKSDSLPVTSPYVPTVQSERNLGVNEEFHKLRSQLIRLTRGEEFRNTLLVTSSVSGEGKTVSALNLAVSLAQEYDYTVLLVDADLRKPSVHQYLGFEPTVGLIQCLNGEATLEQALIKTGLGKLVILPAGGVVKNPVELLSSSRTQTLIKELKHRYPERYVVIDSPPLLPFADAHVLSEMVDGVLFVVREGWAKFDAVRQSLEVLPAEKLLGVVYNDSHNDDHNQQGHYSYY